MAEAYGVLANGGVKVQPTAIIKIVDRNGQVGGRKFHPRKTRR